MRAWKHKNKLFGIRYCPLCVWRAITDFLVCLQSRWRFLFSFLKNFNICSSLSVGGCFVVCACERLQVTVFLCFFYSCDSGRYKKRIEYKKGKAERRWIEMRNQGEITEKRDACAERGCTEQQWVGCFTKEKFEEGLKKKMSQKIWGMWRFSTQKQGQATK